MYQSSGQQDVGTPRGSQISQTPDTWQHAEPKRATSEIKAGSAERAGRIRKGRPSAGYTVVQNSLINHPSLSIEARGLMIYLLSRPEDWELQIGDVRRFLGREGKPCGRDKAYAVVRELKDSRYVVMCEDVDGSHFKGVTYYIFDEPVRDPDEVRRRHIAGDEPTEVAVASPLTENQEAGTSPLPCFPDTENQHGTKYRYIQNLESPQPPKSRKTRRPRARERAREADVADQRVVVAEPWSVEWVEHRTRLLQRGREHLPAKASRFVQQIIDKGGEAGERERLAHQARTCWPTVRAMDEATQDARGWRVSADLFDLDLASRYRSVRIDSPAFAEWQEEHRRRGWPPFPIPSRATHVWLPAEGIAALNIPNAHLQGGDSHEHTER